jgi:DNA-binding response OmpR family regulator
MLKNKVLVVEDEPAIRVYMVDGLKHAGFLVIDASNGQEALTKIKDFTPDLVITDAIMPMMNGYELCVKLHAIETLKDVPVIFCTASSLEKVDRQGVNPTAYVSKPFEIDVLCRKVKELLSGA